MEGRIVETLADIRARLSWGYSFKAQFAHLLLVSVLVPGALYLAGPLDAETQRAAVSLLAVVVAHQVVVRLVFRAQICFGTLSRLLGRADLVVWCSIFFPFLAARVVGTVILGRLDAGSLDGPRALHIVGGCALLLPALYTLWSVLAHFGLIRAVGADHFRERYRQMPMVTQGAFRFSDSEISPHLSIRRSRSVSSKKIQPITASWNAPWPAVPTSLSVEMTIYSTLGSTEASSSWSPRRFWPSSTKSSAACRSPCIRCILRGETLAQTGFARMPFASM